VKNEEIKRCAMVKKVRLEWEGHVIRRDEGELVKNIVE
jgi:hypothetical protein